MTKVDELATVPPVDEAARRRLAAALDVDGVVSALLFGSQATGRAGPLSDIDIGIWLDPGLDHRARAARQLELIGLASDALSTGEVQVVVLNDVPSLLAHRVLRDGVRLVDRDPKARIRLEARALLEYLDTAPLRAALAAGVRHRIEEGRFGRR